MAASYSLSSDVYVNICDLEPGRTSSGVKVRVIRCYREPSPHKSDPDGTLELILHDEIEDRIHATTDYGVFKDKKLYIVEGGLYRIKNFMVAHDMSKYKTTTNRFKLSLLIKTSITPFKDNEFPSAMHRFRDLFEIDNDINVDNFHLLEYVIGRVVSYQKPTFVAKLSTRRMDFKIASTEIKVSNTFHVTKVTVNGHRSQNNGIAEEVNDIYALFKENSAQVREISSLTVTPRISDRDGSRPENRERTSTGSMRLSLAEIERKGGFVMHHVGNVSRRCLRMKEIGTALFVVKITSLIISGYKIEVFVADSSGCTTMLMWDAQCTQLIGKPAKYMKEINDKAGTRIPRELHEALVDKRVLFEVKTPSNKVNTDVPQFTISRIAIDEDIFDIYSKNTPQQEAQQLTARLECEIIDEACSRQRKGKQKVNGEENLENESDVDEGLNLREEKQVVDCEENIQDENENSVVALTLKDLKEKKNVGCDAKYSQRTRS
ncbi:hypothetical protein CASFOL_014465 [Castilleja foliolosa]|uniref:Replication protein A 70 kDa DNA-binding subunit B/D first OB fold domain-containing protein n=1 Tax=Castilleja foliolosa TaxID=1961234 RepID=A0ABD3DMX4_9LAMI